MATIQGSRVALEGKIDSMAVDINHLRMDLWKLADCKAAIEDDVTTLKAEVKRLRVKVDGLKCSTTQMEERLEDAEGRSRHYNLCIVGFPGRVEGASV
ncbi:hypothetical protein NDU88_007810 [Pleurodeles waltl]|uniref:Uncharacterized protein n=1 Tax=Pleurodeles waltl TaxID=8319 RepID=A0AAV7PUZ2_PLEWA|nr:hypothetical protein NDU88_007810 [Pleurodeles waltl]